jgi:hypothetical protein
VKSITVLEPVRSAVRAFPDLAPPPDRADLADRVGLADRSDPPEGACEVLLVLAADRRPARRSGREARSRESPGRMLK